MENKHNNIEYECKWADIYMEGKWLDEVERYSSTNIGFHGQIVGRKTPQIQFIRRREWSKPDFKVQVHFTYRQSQEDIDRFWERLKNRSYLENPILPYSMFLLKEGFKWNIKELSDLRDFYVDGKNDPKMLEWFPDIIYRIQVIEETMIYFLIHDKMPDDSMWHNI